MSIETAIADFLSHNELQGRTVHLSPALWNQLDRKTQKRGRVGRSRVVLDETLPERQLDLYVSPDVSPDSG